MVADILMAFVVALLLEMFGLINKSFKPATIIGCCISLIAVYFLDESSLNFIGEMNFAIWILFVALFDAILTLLEHGIAYILNEIKNDEKCVNNMR